MTDRWRPGWSGDRSRRRSWRRSRAPRSKTWRRVVPERLFRVWRGTAAGGSFVEYRVEGDPGMGVLDVLHPIQAKLANDLAVRRNRKAGKCGSGCKWVNGETPPAPTTRD